ncbi:MAG: RNA polymerase factor sigma-54 [Spirochaetales bacterium]|nr:RNA polymerase factor sigma-54 [Spirochaetales bacterium]
MQVQKPIMRQEQKLKMTPQLYQAIQIMSLPLLDLLHRIQDEIEQNPALEILKDGPTLSYEEEAAEKNTEEYDYFEGTSDPGFTNKYSGNNGEDLKRKFIEGTISRLESLQEHLLWQLRVQPIPKEWLRIGEIVISNLDENGFFLQPLEKIVKLHELDILKKVIKIIQTFDPVGCCTHDYREALLVQIENHPHPLKYSYELVELYLDLVEKKKYREIAQKLEIEADDVLKAVDFLKNFEPLPGRNFTSEQPKYVVPDVMIKLKDGEFVLILNDEEIPVLGINPFFTDLMGREKLQNKKDVNQFVNTNIKSARWFIQAINKRNETLLNVCRAIIECQRDFFRKGPKYLVPLTLKDIAKEIGVHEATISRITTEKYIQTEWGIYELKFFFSNAVSGDQNTNFSKQGVKHIIKEIIENDGTEKHLSDNRIAEILSQKGIKIARRTVAKYRKELDIMSSYNR